MEIEYLKKIVEEVTGCDVNEKTRKREVVEARMIYYSILVDYARFTLTKIGKSVGKDHATVLYNYRQSKFIIPQDKILNKKYLKIRNKFLGIIEEEEEEQEVDLNKENAELKSALAELQNEMAILKEDLKKLSSNSIKPKNQQTKVYYASEGISDMIF